LFDRIYKINKKKEEKEEACVTFGILNA